MFLYFGRCFCDKNDFYHHKNTFAFYIFWGIFVCSIFPIFTEINPYGFWYSTFIKAMKIWAIVCIVISTFNKIQAALKVLTLKINLNSILEKKNPGIKEYLKIIYLNIQVCLLYCCTPFIRYVFLLMYMNICSGQAFFKLRFQVRLFQCLFL